MGWKLTEFLSPLKWQASFLNGREVTICEGRTRYKKPIRQRGQNQVEGGTGNQLQA